MFFSVTRIQAARLALVAMAALPLAGCKRTATPPPAPAGPVKKAGRLVPAVVAGFERGPGGWRVETATGGAAPQPIVVSGGASRGEKWLAVPVAVPAGQEMVMDVVGLVPSMNWTRFGDTLRADVRTLPGGVKATVQPYVVSPSGDETVGTPIEVTSAWKSVVWNAGQALGNVARIGLRWKVTGAWTGQLGIDNVRIGAADALSTAYSVAYGPFASREQAAGTMATLKRIGVDSFPIYEQGWYLNLGTFSTRAAAGKESQRLRAKGLTTTVLVR
jgi:hypothetical protein